MVKNLTSEKIHLFIVEDFKGAWDSIAANPKSEMGRGNFMFARQAMNLLEFAARLCHADPSEAAIRDFSSELKNIEAKYFTPLPGKCKHPHDFTFPYTSSKNETSLLAVLYDLIRHGLAHQYQQIIVKLNDQKNFYVSITGADHGQYLDTFKDQRPPKHLAYTVDNDGDVKLIIYPQILFLDFEKAIGEAHILKMNLQIRYLERSESGGYAFGTESLENSLVSGNHIKFQSTVDYF